MTLINCICNIVLYCLFMLSLTHKQCQAKKSIGRLGQLFVEGRLVHFRGIVGIWIINMLIYACNTGTLMCIIHNKSRRGNYNCFIVTYISNLAELREQSFCVTLSTLICIHVSVLTIGIK